MIRYVSSNRLIWSRQISAPAPHPGMKTIGGPFDWPASITRRTTAGATVTRFSTIGDAISAETGEAIAVSEQPSRAQKRIGGKKARRMPGPPCPGLEHNTCEFRRRGRHVQANVGATT